MYVWIKALHVIAVISGAVREDRMRLGSEPLSRVIEGRSSFTVPPVAIHRVMHAGCAPAVTIHAYSPPLTRTGVYRVGETGELCVAGPQTTPGYWRAPEITADRFVSLPVSRHETRRFYRTGDLVARLPEGDYVFLGRADQQLVDGDPAVPGHDVGHRVGDVAWMQRLDRGRLALGRQPQRGGAADAAARPGHQRRRPVQYRHHEPPGQALSGAPSAAPPMKL